MPNLSLTVQCAACNATHCHNFGLTDAPPFEHISESINGRYIHLFFCTSTPACLDGALRAMREKITFRIRVAS